jgi:hypothetical protein
MSRTNEITGFQIVLSDGVSDVYTYSIPHQNLVPTNVYTSYQDAKDALEAVSAKLPKFIPVAYGEAFPYENVSFGKMLQEKGYAAYGWMIVEDDDVGAEEFIRLEIGLLRVKLVVSSSSA